MKFSMKWLNEFVNINNIDEQEFSKAMEKIGFKIKNYEVQGERLKNIVVGRILFIDEHPYADRLSVCSVHVGIDKPVQIVTNATNLKASNLVPVALDGAVLADGTVINEGKIRDILSSGMFCSIAELGIKKQDYPGASDDEVLILNNDCKIGQNIKEAINFNDTWFDIEIPNRRPDCNSVIGMSREISAKFDKLLRIHTPKITSQNGNAKDLLNIKVDVPDICPFCCAAVVKNIKLGESPKWIKDKLICSNIKPVNNIIDVANYVMLEYGHPINVFDYRSIENGNLIIRHADPNETIVTLDFVTRTLTNDSIVLADENKSFSIPGIMRGEAGCITKDTSTVVFEAASLDKEYVKNISKKLNVTTDQSIRFENGLDQNNCIPALMRVCEIIEMLNIGKTLSPIIRSNLNIIKQKRISFSPQKINEFLNSSFSEENMKQILKKIGCVFEDNNILVIPSYRSDLENIYDIAGEIVRFYGYDKITQTSISPLNFSGYSDKYKTIGKVKQTLISLGLDEVKSSLIIDKKDLNKSNIKSENIAIIPSENDKILRPSPVPSFLHVALKSGEDSGEFFEIANEYSLDEDNNVITTKNLTAMFLGDSYDFYDIKGIVEEIFETTSTTDYTLEKNCESLTLDPGKSALIKIDGKEIGYLGALHPQVLTNYGINKNIFLFNTNLDIIC